MDGPCAVGGLWAARSGLLRAERDAGGLALVWRELEAAGGVHVSRKKEGEQDLVLLQVEMLDTVVEIRAVEAAAAERDARRGVRGGEAEGMGWRLPWGASQHGGFGVRGANNIFHFCEK